LLRIGINWVSDLDYERKQSILVICTINNESSSCWQEILIDLKMHGVAGQCTKTLTKNQKSVISNCYFTGDIFFDQYQ